MADQLATVRFPDPHRTGPCLYNQQPSSGPRGAPRHRPNGSCSLRRAGRPGRPASTRYRGGSGTRCSAQYLAGRGADLNFRAGRGPCAAAVACAHAFCTPRSCGSGAHTAACGRGRGGFFPSVFGGASGHRVRLRDECPRQLQREKEGAGARYCRGSGRSGSTGGGAGAAAPAGAGAAAGVRR